MGFKAQIEKLEGSKNWTKWKRQVELLLCHHDVLDIVTMKRSKPTCSGAPATNEERTNRSCKTREIVYKKRCSGKYRANSHI